MSQKHGDVYARISERFGRILRCKKSAEKDLRKIPKEIIPHIFEHIENLVSAPVPHDAYKLASAENLYRIRIGDYRVIYQVLHGSREVTVIYIRHRSVAYRGL